MLLFQLQLPSRMKVLAYSSLLLQKTAKRKKTSSKMFHLLSRILTYQIYLIVAKLKMLQTHLHQESNLHGKQMLNKSEL